jgi:hypothetical protein
MAPVNPQSLMGKRTTVQSAAVAPQQQLVAAPADTAALQSISKSLTNIIQLLSQQNTQTQRETEQERKSQERSRRKGIELGLENSFNAVKSVAQSVVAPVQNILGQIIQFFVTLFLGRALIQLMNWFADPNNQSKIRSIMRFLRDWWPSLVAGYILFGTGFGRIVRKVAGVAVGAVARLTVIAARLAKAIATGKGLKGAAAAFAGGGRLGGWKGALLKLGIGTAATIGTGIAINSAMGGGAEPPQLSVPDAPSVPALGAKTGGLANLKDLFSNSTSGLSSKFNPFVSFFGSGGLANLMAGVRGVVSGPKGIDKVPAMLTDGEFVMSRGAVQKFGVNTLEAMNSAGGGTNRPRIVNQRVYAAGGGLIGGMGSDYKAQEAAAAEAARQYQMINQNVREATGGRYIQSDYVRNLRYKNALDKIKSQSINQSINIQPQKSPTPKISISPNINPNIKVQAPTIDPKREAERESRKKARAEYVKIINNPDDPRYQDAWDGKLTIDSLKVDVNQKSKPTPTKPIVEYTPYKSRFAGARDAAHERASRIQGSRPYVNPFSAGGMFGGPSMSARQEYAASKGKYYSSSDQKTYGSYDEAKDARKARLTSLASQQGLDKLSYAGANRSSRGVRFDAESKARGAEFRSRGGLMGQLGRLGQRVFGGAGAQQNLDAQQKASEARIKQAGAESIGKYYSSSDGKYYKDYNAAVAARQARIAKSSPNKPNIGPTPKPEPKIVSSKSKVAGGGMGGRRGGGAKPSIPQFSTSGKSSRKEKNIYGIK